MRSKEHLEKISIPFVIEQIPKSLALFSLSSILGYLIPKILNEVVSSGRNIVNLYVFLLKIKTLSLSNPIGIFLNNWIAIVLSLILSILFVYKRKNQSRYTVLIFLYFVPIVVVIVNGFFLGAMTSTIKGLRSKIMAFLPYGAFEITAMILSSSLGLAFTEALEPYLGEKGFKKKVKKLWKNKAVIFYLIIITSLILFSAMMESEVIELVKTGIYNISFE